MTERDEAIARRASESFADFMENGPRLWRGRRSYVLARCDQGHVLLGGLGAMGVGQMWFTEADHHRKDPTYADAEIVEHSDNELRRY